MAIDRQVREAVVRESQVIEETLAAGVPARRRPGQRPSDRQPELAVARHRRHRRRGQDLRRLARPREIIDRQSTVELEDVAPGGAPLGRHLEARNRQRQIEPGDRPGAGLAVDPQRPPGVAPQLRARNGDRHQRVGGFEVPAVDLPPRLDRPSQQLAVEREVRLVAADARLGLDRQRSDRGEDASAVEPKHEIGRAIAGGVPEAQERLQTCEVNRLLAPRAVGGRHEHGAVAQLEAIDPNDHPLLLRPGLGRRLGGSLLPRRQGPRQVHPRGVGFREQAR